MNNLEDIGLMETDKYVSDMDKPLASWIKATCVNVGMLHINGTQALIWWVYSTQKNGIALDMTIFAPDMIFGVIQNKIIKR